MKQYGPFTAAVTGLSYLAEDRNGSAISYLLSIKQFDFIITLLTIQHAIQRLLPLITFLLTKQCDLVQAPAIIAKLQQETAEPET